MADRIFATGIPAATDSIMGFTGGANKYYPRRDGAYMDAKAMLEGNSSVTFNDTNKTITLSTGQTYTGAEIVALLTALTGDDRLDMNAVKGNLPYSRVSGTPTIPTVPDRAGAFTQAYQNKVDGIQEGAQVNPTAGKHLSYNGSTLNVDVPVRVHKLSAEDANATDGLQDGEWGIYNGSTQIQTTPIHQADRLYFPNSAATYGQDATNPTTDLDAVDNRDYFGYIVESEQALLFTINLNGQTDYAIARMPQGNLSTVTGGYLASNIVWEGADISAPSEGVGWDIRVSPTTRIISDDLIGVVKAANLPARTGAFTAADEQNLDRVAAIDHTQYVDRSELEGKETDRYASYTNGFMAQSGYRVGFISLFNQSTVPTDDTNAVRQPDIDDDTTVVLAWGARLRLDKDPNHFQADTTDFTPANGDTLYVSIWNDTSARMDVTLTSTPAKVGTGDAAFYWATASVDEVNNIPDVAVVGDYFKVADEAPSDLDLRIPVKDVIGALDTDANGITPEGVARIQGDNEESTLDNTFRVDTTNEDYYVALTETSSPYTARIRLPSSRAGTDDDNDLKRLLKQRAWVEIGDYRIDVTTNATRALIGTSLTYTFNYVVVAGTKPTGSTPVSVRVVGEDVHRGELARQAFREETPSVGGKGGNDGQVWTRVSGEGGWANAPKQWVSQYSSTATISGNWTNLVSSSGYSDGDEMKLKVVARTGSNRATLWNLEWNWGDLYSSGDGTESPPAVDAGNRLALRVNGGNLQMRKLGGGAFDNAHVDLYRYE